MILSDSATVSEKSAQRYVFPEGRHDGGAVAPKRSTHPVEVSSKRCLSETSVRGASPPRLELVASFHECQHGSPWPSWRPRVVARCDASEKYAARRGSVGDGVRMITACFARAPQRCTRALSQITENRKVWTRKSLIFQLSLSRFMVCCASDITIP
jgi:hypothetical protein